MNTRKRDTRWLVLLALFVAIEIFLNVTGIGLIPLPLIKASTLHIPVIIGAVLLGPMAGGVLGGVFGLCSIWSNSTAPGLLSFAFSPFLATSAAGAVKTIWIAFGCRVLIGVVAGWLWILLKKLRASDMIALPVVGFIGSMTNTVTVMGSIFFLFRAEYAAANKIGRAHV